MDLAVDENGLWAMMAMKENNNTLVMKMSSDLELIWAWNISLNHNLVRQCRGVMPWCRWRICS